MLGQDARNEVFLVLGSEVRHKTCMTSPVLHGHVALYPPLSCVLSFKKA